MTERKPPGVSFETWVDRQIREAQERGAFDNLPGAGKPLPDAGRPFDMDRWVVDWARREGLSAEAMLPEPLRLRREIERLPDAVRDLRSERAVRDLATDLNRRIADWTRRPVGGPQVPVAPVDIDGVVAQWRAHRRAAAAARSTPATGVGRRTGDDTPRRRVRWWHRFAAVVRGRAGGRTLWRQAGTQCGYGSSRHPIGRTRRRRDVADLDRLPAGLDPNTPNVARVYDYWLGGKDNFQADREFAERIIAIEPAAPYMARQNRRFLGRAVRFLTEQAGIRQFIDIGTGLPTQRNVHQVAPDARVVYVDNDEVVRIHASALLADGSNVTAIRAGCSTPAVSSTLRNGGRMDPRARIPIEPGCSPAWAR
jgi:hypothetical protein